MKTLFRLLVPVLVVFSVYLLFRFPPTLSMDKNQPNEKTKTKTNSGFQMPGSLPSLLRVPAKVTPSATIIIAHGLGDQGQSWKFLADIFHQFPDFQHISFVFPNAPKLPLTIRGGHPEYRWFDIYEMGNPNAKQDVDGYFHSVDQMKALIKKEVELGIPADRIILGGFSQGASISLATLATFDTKIAGLLVMSGFANIRDEVKAKLSEANKETPIFHGHGDKDLAIKIDYAHKTHEFYESLGFKNYQFHEYPGMGHSTCKDELRDIFQFVKNTLPKEKK